MNRINIIGVILLCLLATACKKEDIQLYSSDAAGIYFQQGDQTRLFINSESYYDSTSFSFSIARITTMDTLLRVKIRTLGKVANVARPIKLTVDKENTTAIEGKHYQIKLDTAAVPAGASTYYFYVKFFRTADLLTGKAILALKLEDNEHFKAYIQEQKNTNVYTSVGELIDADRFRFIVSEIYTKPSYWTNFGNAYFGTWTVSKYKYVNAVLGWTPADWQNGGATTSAVQLGRFGAAALTVRNALQALANAGTPKLDDDGLPMQMGAAYQVTY